VTLSIARPAHRAAEISGKEFPIELLGVAHRCTSAGDHMG
jgi:hypothetical protein